MSFPSPSDTVALLVRVSEDSMTELDLPQAIADTLLAIEKHPANNDLVLFPGPGESVNLPLVAIDHSEFFSLDLFRSSITLIRKGTFQTRARGIVILARLDFGGAPHRNPDDSEIPCPHLHLYREHFGDKWAFPLDSASFADPDDSWRTMNDFLRYCNVTRTPNIQKGLFS